MGRKKLTQKNETTIASESSYIHVVKGSVSYKITKANFQKNLTSGFQGGLSIADTPTSDGYYIAEESGTYTNAGSLVVDLTNTLTYINVEDSQTTFTLIEIPIETDIETMVLLFSGQSNMVNGEPSMNDGGDKGTDERVEVWDDVLGAFKIAELGQHPFPTALNDEGKYNNNLAFHISKRIAEKENKKIKIIFEATGGASIDKWTDNGVNSEYFVNIKNKLINSGVTKVDSIFWLQGESDAFDIDYSNKLGNILIPNLRDLPSISDTTPFIAGQLAYGYDINGTPIGSSGGGSNPYSAGHVLNKRFYRQFHNFINDLYFNVADGHDLSTVSPPSAAAGIHFHGTAIVEYANRFVQTYYATPLNPPSLVNFKRYNPEVYTVIGAISDDSNEIAFLDASGGDLTISLPLPLFKNKLILKRIDANSSAKVTINISSGNTINGTEISFELLKINQTVTLIPTSDTNYDIVDNNYNYKGTSLVQGTQNNPNHEKHVHLDNTTNNVTLNFYLPNVSYGLSFYVKRVNAGSTKPCRIFHSTTSNLDTGASIDLAVDDLYYCYSDSIVYHTQKINVV